MLHILGLVDSHGVDYTTFQLDGPAKQWWRSYMSCRSTESPPMTWATFFEAFLAKYEPCSMRERLRDEFIDLRQGSMSVSEYENRFYKLSIHGAMIMPTESERVRHFVMGLGLRLREVTDRRSFSEVVEHARTMESLHREAYGGSNKRPRYQGSFSGSPSGDGGHSGLVGLPHQGAPRRGCYKCGQLGDFAKECPRLRQGGQSGQQVQAPWAPLQLTRDGAHGSRGGPQGVRGGAQPGRSGGQVGVQSGGGRGHCYAFLGQLEAEASNVVITGHMDIPKGDKLVLRGLKFHGYHGVKQEERKLGQKFLVDVDAWMDLRAAGQSDCLSDTLSYTDIYRIVKEVMEGPPKNLLEAVAQLIASATLTKYPQVSAVRVQVGKPHVAVQGPVDYLGVEIIRYRS